PPASLQTGDVRGVAKTVLQPVASRSVSEALTLAPKEEQRTPMSAAHARLDSASASGLLQWLAAARSLPTFQELVAARLSQDEADVPALRAEQDNAEVAGAKQAVCARHVALAARHPDNADLEYVALRCKEAPNERDEGFLAAQARHPR